MRGEREREAPSIEDWGGERERVELTHFPHNISLPVLRYEAYCRCGDFIREHVFPGGHLPSVGAMVEASRGTGLSLKVWEKCEYFGCMTTWTCRIWRVDSY